MAAARARVGVSLCLRLSAGLRCNGTTRRLLLDSTKLSRQSSVNLVKEMQAATTTKRMYSANFSTSSVLPAVGLNTEPQVAENPDSRSSSDGGGIMAAEAEEDDDPFMKEMVRRYELCRRWLATIMGEDPENFTEEDIKAAIEYLMPTGLYAKDARPLLIHPKKLFTKRKAQLFDATGRPIDPAFYTGRPAYHKLIYDIYKEFEKLELDRVHRAYEEQQRNAISSSYPENQLDRDREGKEDSKTTSSFPTMRWIKKIELDSRLEEMLSDREYDTVIHRLKKLSNQPDAHLAQDFLDQFIVPVPTPGMAEVTLEIDDQGRAHGIGHRKRAIAEVWITEGQGRITVNDFPFVEYFDRLPDRQQVLFPFQVIDGVGQYDAVCHVIGGGLTGQAGAIRLAVSRALLNFSEDFLGPFQEAGLLIRDTRVVERKKPGQKKARKKFAWVKR